jgi:hypothetical protein
MPLSVNSSKAPVPHFSLLQKHEKLQRDYLWISSQKEKLRRENNNKYIAVKDQKIVLADDDVFRLLAKLKAQGWQVDDFAVEYISESPACLLL